jgi:uncharacterized protein YlxW (UPF0749 family)
MARALLGYATNQNRHLLDIEVARLRARVRELEAELAALRASNTELDLELRRLSEAAGPVPA